MILRKFRRQIEDIINQSGLPIDAIYFVVKDIYAEITNIYSNEMQKEDVKAAAQEAAATSKEENKQDN